MVSLEIIHNNDRFFYRQILICPKNETVWQWNSFQPECISKIKLSLAKKKKVRQRTTKMQNFTYVKSPEKVNI